MEQESDPASAKSPRGLPAPESPDSSRKGNSKETDKDSPDSQARLADALNKLKLGGSAKAAPRHTPAPTEEDERARRMRELEEELAKLKNEKAAPAPTTNPTRSPTKDTPKGDSKEGDSDEDRLAAAMARLGL